LLIERNYFHTIWTTMSSITAPTIQANDVFSISICVTYIFLARYKCSIHTYIHTYIHTPDWVKLITVRWKFHKTENRLITIKFNNGTKHLTSTLKFTINNRAEWFELEHKRRILKLFLTSIHTYLTKKDFTRTIQKRYYCFLNGNYFNYCNG